MGRPRQFTPEQLKERRRKRSLDWYYRNKQKVKDYKKDYRKRKKEHLNEYAKKLRKRKRKEIMKQIGDKCIVCGSSQKIRFHEIHGKEHHDYSRYGYVLSHIEDFVPMCRDCHRALHQLGEKVDIGEFLRLRSILLNEF